MGPGESTKFITTLEAQFFSKWISNVVSENPGAKQAGQDKVPAFFLRENRGESLLVWGTSFAGDFDFFLGLEASGCLVFARGIESSNGTTVFRNSIHCNANSFNNGTKTPIKKNDHAPGRIALSPSIRLEINSTSVHTHCT